MRIDRIAEVKPDGAGGRAAPARLVAELSRQEALELVAYLATTLAGKNYTGGAFAAPCEDMVLEGEQRPKPYRFMAYITDR